MIALTYDNKESFVSKLVKKGIDVRWRGWDMVFFRPDHRARRNPRGVFRNGAFGYETVVSPNNDGLWLVDYRLTRKQSGV